LLDKEKTVNINLSAVQPLKFGTRYRKDGAAPTGDEVNAVLSVENVQPQDIYQGSSGSFYYVLTGDDAKHAKKHGIDQTITLGTFYRIPDTFVPRDARQ
jgi:hypothetical protein